MKVMQQEMLVAHKAWREEKKRLFERLEDSKNDYVQKNRQLETKACELCHKIDKADLMITE